jgi:hypothetical protein
MGTSFAQSTVTMAQCRLDAAKRARRAHRKSIASIVVQRWRSFASDRLRAYRHHKRKLLLAGLAGFISEVQSSKRIQRNAVTLQSKFRYRRTCASLWEWWRIVQRERKLRAIGQIIDHTITHRVLRGVWGEWAAFIIRQRQKQRSRAKADAFFCFLLVSKSVHAWHQYNYLRHVKAWHYALATEYARTRTCRVFLAAWKQKVYKLHHGRQIAEEKCDQKRCSLLRGAILALQKTAAQQRQARIRFHEQLTQIAYSIDTMLVHEMFHEWAAHVGLKRRLAHLGMAVVQVSTQHEQRWACHMCVRRSRFCHYPCLH